jgi:DNA primase
MIAQASISEVMNRIDIVEIIGQFIRLKRRGTTYVANCPFHNEKSPSFSVSPPRGIYKCFGCGRGGNAVTFIQEHEKLTYPEAIRWLAGYYKIELEETERSLEQIAQIKIEESLRLLNEFASAFFRSALLESEEGTTVGMPYFKMRGFREDIIQRFQLGYNPERDPLFSTHALKSGYALDLLERAGLVKSRNGSTYDAYRGRVIFPIHNMTGRILGFGARILKSNEKAPKYVNTPENELYHKSRVLYGLYQSRQAISKANECLLVEGYTDVISLHQGGVEHVVASSGTALTTDQLRLLGQLTRNLTILYDGDAAGIKAALRGLDMALGQSFNVKLVLLPAGEDPDSLIRKSGSSTFLEYIKEHKQDVISFRLQVGLAEAGADPKARSQLINEIAESISLINKAEDFSLQQHYIRETALKMGVDEEGLINLVNKYIRDRMDAERKTNRPDSTAPHEVLPSAIDQPDVPPADDLVAPANNTELQEWELIKVLLDHGSKAYEGFPHVASLIFDRVDPELIESPLPNSLFHEYFDLLNASQTPPEADYFIRHPDPAVQVRIASLLQNNLEISPNWKIMYGIVSVHSEFNYINEVDSALMYFELKKLIQMQEALTQMLKGEKDDQKVTELQQRFLELRLAERDIVARYGTVVLKLLRKAL